MAITRTLSKDGLNLGLAVSAVLGAFGLNSINKNLEKKLPEKAEEIKPQPPRGKMNSKQIIKCLSKLSSDSFRVTERIIDGEQHRIIYSKLPAVMHDILHDALNNMSICDYYDGTDGIFSLVASNTASSLECMWTGESWMFFHNNRPLPEEEALVIYRGLARDLIEYLNTAGVVE